MQHARALDLKKKLTNYNTDKAFCLLEHNKEKDNIQVSSTDICNPHYEM